MRGRTNIVARPTPIVNGDLKEFVVADGETIEIGDFVEYSYHSKDNFYYFDNIFPKQSFDLGNGKILIIYKQGNNEKVQYTVAIFQFINNDLVKISGNVLFPSPSSTGIYNDVGMIRKLNETCYVVSLFPDMDMNKYDVVNVFLIKINDEKNQVLYLDRFDPLQHIDTKKADIACFSETNEIVVFFITGYYDFGKTEKAVVCCIKISDDFKFVLDNVKYTSVWDGNVAENVFLQYVDEQNCYFIVTSGSSSSTSNNVYCRQFKISRDFTNRTELVVNNSMNFHASGSNMMSMWLDDNVVVLDEDDGIVLLNGNYAKGSNVNSIDKSAIVDLNFNVLGSNAIICSSYKPWHFGLINNIGLGTSRFNYNFIARVFHYDETSDSINTSNPVELYDREKLSGTVSYNIFGVLDIGNGDYLLFVHKGYVAFHYEDGVLDQGLTGNLNVVEKYDGFGKTLGFAKTGGFSGETIKVYVPKIGGES